MSNYIILFSCGWWANWPGILQIDFTIIKQPSERIYRQVCCRWMRHRHQGKVRPGTSLQSWPVPRWWSANKESRWWGSDTHKDPSTHGLPLKGSPQRSTRWAVVWCTHSPGLLRGRPSSRHRLTCSCHQQHESPGHSHKNSSKLKKMYILNMSKVNERNILVILKLAPICWLSLLILKYLKNLDVYWISITILSLSIYYIL